MNVENIDDCMEIDDPLSVTPIIERKSDEFRASNHNIDTGISNASSQKEKGTGVNASSTSTISCETPRSSRAPSVLSTQISTDNPPSSSASIVILDDDEEIPSSSNPSISETQNKTDSAVKEIIDLVDTPKNSRCINTNCSGKSMKFIFAPDFCLSFFRVKKSSANEEEICMDCYDKAVEENDKLATTLKEGKLLFDCDFPIINETLQIDDSDEDGEVEGEMEFITDENFKYITENIEEVLMETLDKLDMKNHLEKEREFLKKEAEKVEADCEELCGKVSEIRKVLDKIQIDLYNQFRPELRTLKGIMILDDYSLSQNIQIRPEYVQYPESSRKSNRTGQKPVSYAEEFGAFVSSKTGDADSPQPEVEIPKDLPMTQTTEKPVLQIDQIYYIMRESNPQGSWVKARLQQIISPNTTYKGQSWTDIHYRLIELKQQKERIINGKQMAFISACKSRLTVGTRVISTFKIFKETTSPDVKQPKTDPYYAGVVGEHPVESNKYRYLIFFDIGYAQYVQHSGINLVYEASTNVWEDMPEDSRPFIKKYLESQDRPMVKLTPNQTVRVEYNGKWWLCTIKAVDCSLVQVYFDQISRWEWIYRGSTRLSPMFREELAATTRHTGLRATRKLGMYTRNNDYVQPSTKDSAAGVTRAVARKSTTKPNAVNQPVAKCVPFLPQVNPTQNNFTGPTSKIMYFTPRDQQVIKREYKQHECGPACKGYLTHNFTKLRGHNPLSKPLLCGWARMTLKDRGRKEIIYKAPCGRMIRNISEIHYYLRVTESEMTVDLFDFNHMVRCLAEFSVECTPDPKDLSKGLEQVPIPVINGFNNDMLDFCNYSTKRVPMEGVHMNLDSEFLCGCDCDDDCVDKLKCSCWKLTLEGIKYLGKDTDPISVGYIYRRLQEQVITGIYECNSRGFGSENNLENLKSKIYKDKNDVNLDEIKNAIHIEGDKISIVTCKCTSTCLNRVAQNPLSLKLQVFKTHNRGWGIRCLNDIPQGTFICIYAGTLHTEQMANEDGMAYGDEYFAELDYIETVEKYKEDYEEEVMEDDYYKEKSPPPADETKIFRNASSKKRNTYMEDDDFTPRHPMADRRHNGDDGIRSRLRKRKDEDDRKAKEESKESDVKVKQEPPEKDIKSLVEKVTGDIDTVTISDDEDEGREVLSFNPKANDMDDKNSKYLSVRELFGSEESENIYIMDAKNAGNIGRFLNHSCSPNVFVQNVFVDTHDLRFPWVAFFSSQFIRAGTELTWNYNYDIGSVPGRVLYCHCASLECKGRLL